MKKEQIQEFTRRISQSNRAGMTVVVYDILFAYLKDAKEAGEEKQYEDFRDNVKQAQKVLQHLMQTLNFQYPIAKELYPLYVFCNETLSKAVIRNQVSDLAIVQEVLEGLYESFEKIAAKDHSEPLMKNTQQVYAGMTYGKSNLTETFQEPESSRGFFA